MKHLDIIMEEMCKRVGAEWKNIDPKEEGWYTKYEWTLEEYESFSDWMADYLYTNNEARKSILEYNTTNKQKINKAVNWFLFNYGWKIKND